MEHAVHLVDVLDTQGKVIGQKPRNTLDKTRDIHHTVFALLITPKGELVLSVIPAREDLPNLFARQLGATMATIRRTHETPQRAALRGLERELFIDQADIHFLGTQMYILPEGAALLGSVYYLVANPPSGFSLLDIDTLAVVTPTQLREIIETAPHTVAPTLRLIWENYAHKIPI